MAKPVACDCMSCLKASQKQYKTKLKQNTAMPNMHVGGVVSNFRPTHGLNQTTQERIYSSL